MDNAYYARIMREISLLMQIKGENRFKIRAFDNAATILEDLTSPIDALVEGDALTQIDGIGKSIAQDLKEIYQTGTCGAREALLDSLDRGLLALLHVQGLGPKRIKLLYEQLGIANMEALKDAAQRQQIRQLAGFGAKTEQNILEDIERLSQHAGRTPLPAGLALAQHVCEVLSQLPQAQRVEIAGSLRRGRETIGDIDILVASDDPQPILDATATMRGVSKILAHGAKKTSVLLGPGVQVDVRVVEPQVFGSALHYFTGSKEHHVKLRTRAKRQGLKISEYGVFREGSDEAIACATEEDVFAALGLAFIPPELREGVREIDAAQDGKLPQLITLADVRGDLHMHTTASDGEHSILEMAHAAKALGYEYIVITDHSQSLTVANGLTPERLERHIEAIREADRQIDGFRILSGLEVDILKDGALDMTDELLQACDWVVGSVHSLMNQTSEVMTQRLLRAISSGLIQSLGHPTGRILGGRGGYVYDMEAILEACKAHGVAVEINGSTGRLDFNAEHAAMARDRGVKIVLGSDAHSTRGLEVMPLAVQQARRAWLTPADVINAMPMSALFGAL